MENLNKEELKDYVVKEIREILIEQDNVDGKDVDIIQLKHSRLDGQLLELEKLTLTFNLEMKFWKIVRETRKDIEKDY